MRRHSDPSVSLFQDPGTMFIDPRTAAIHAAATPQLHDYLIEAARLRPQQTALVSAGARLSYASLDERSNALARTLVCRGVRRGDRVMVFAENRVEVVVAFWGALKANAVVSIVNPRTRPEKLAYLLGDCRAVALVADGALSPACVDAARRARHLHTVLVCGTRQGDALPDLPGASRWEEALAETPPEAAAPARCNLDVDLAAIVYTSGSTGEPKGVMLTHRNMLTASASICAYLELTRDDVLLCVLPLAFDYGLYQMILAARAGARLVLDRAFAYPAQVLATVARERVSVFPGVPTLFSMLAALRDGGAFDLSSVKTVTNTAAALHESQIGVIQRLFPRARLFSMYGLTECKRCTYLPPPDLQRKPTSVGIAIPNTEIWIVGEQGERLPPGAVGQLVVRGATVMKGYWEKPEETARKLRPGPLPGESVLYTGDLCRLDDEGYLYFVARMDDVIKSRGEKVPPLEVEQALSAIPGVSETAVVGVPDPVLGEAVVAYVVLEAEAALDEKHLHVEAQKRLEPFMVPKRIVIVDALPRGLTGKISRRDLPALS